MRSTALCAAALVAGLGGVAHAQLIVGNDQSAATNAMYHINVNTGVATQILSGADAIAWGMAYSGASNTLYWINGSTLRSAAYNINGLTPSAGLNTTFNGGLVAFTGLAWWDNRLVGYRSVTLPGFYEIDPNTGVATLLAATPGSTDFGGLDAVGNRLFGLNDGTGLSGRGLYDIDMNSNTYSLLAPYPGGDADIDGLAIGGGRAYWVNDVGSQQILVYNLDTGVFEAPLANPFGTGGIFSAGAFVPAPGAGAVVALSGLAILRRRR